MDRLKAGEGGEGEQLIRESRITLQFYFILYAYTKGGIRFFSRLIYCYRFFFFGQFFFYWKICSKNALKFEKLKYEAVVFSRQFSISCKR